MARTSLRAQGLALRGLMALLPLAVGCSPLSESIPRPEVGLNGGFEISEQGKPVNWLLYTPSTVPDAEFKLDLDRTRAAEGEQSLHFAVDHCLAEGGWRSPGCATEQPATPGGRYRVSLKLQNTGAQARLRLGGVSAFKDQLETLALPGNTEGTWLELEHELQMPGNMSTLRLELNVLSPGQVWIDEVRIEELKP
jgi:hypothetical protein